jgi:hypothetical protein
VAELVQQVATREAARSPAIDWNELLGGDTTNPSTQPTTTDECALTSLLGSDWIPQSKPDWFVSTKTQPTSLSSPLLSACYDTSTEPNSSGWWDLHLDPRAPKRARVASHQEPEFATRPRAGPAQPVSLGWSGSSRSVSSDLIGYHKWNGCK